jgi:hypothetical protein
MRSAVLPARGAVAQVANLLAVLGVLVETCYRPEGELMSAESSLTAVAVVRALLDEDTEGLVVLLPDDLPEPGRELIASLASLTVLSVKVAARAERITEGEYLDRLVRLWTDSPGRFQAGNGCAVRGRLSWPSAARLC